MLPLPRLFLLVCFLGCFTSARGSTDTLPPLDTLRQSLRRYHQQELQVQLAEYQLSTKGTWLKYLPNLSLGYTLGTNRNGELNNVLRPSLSINSGVLYRAKRDQQIQDAKIRSLEQRTQLQLQTDLRQLDHLHYQYQAAQQDYHLQTELQTVHRDLFLLAEAQFQRAELLPAAYLTQKRTYLQREYDLLQQKRALDYLRLQVLAAAHWE